MIGTVHCDNCHADIDDVNVQDYFGKACEKCGASPLISDEDKVLADTMDSMQSVGWLRQMTKAEGRNRR